MTLANITQLPRLLHQRMIEIHLGFRKAALKNCEHFPPSRSQLSHLLLNRCVTVFVAPSPTLYARREVWPCEANHS